MALDRVDILYWYRRVQSFLDIRLSVLCMRPKAWLDAPVLLAHAEVTKKHNNFSMGPKLRYPTVLGVRKLPSFGTCSSSVREKEFAMSTASYFGEIA